MTQTQQPPRRRRHIVKPDQITLPVIHLGASLKPEKHDLDELWTYSPTPSPNFSKTHPQNDKNRKTPVPKSPTHKNMLELSTAHKTSLPLNKGYWKIPGLSTNLIGYHSKKYPSKTGLKQAGTYEKKFRTWYNDCLRGNHGLLPPIETSEKANKRFHDAEKSEQKSHISRPLHVSSPNKLLSGSEIHSPKNCSNSVGCSTECMRIYPSEICTEHYLSRNDKSPSYCKSPDMTMSRMRKHNCDVLCESMIEKRNKRFSRKLEESIVSLSEINKTHYSPSSTH